MDNVSTARAAPVTIAGYTYTINQAVDGLVTTSITSKTSKPGKTAHINAYRFSATKTANTVKFRTHTAAVNKATTTKLTVTIPTKCKRGKTCGVPVTVKGQTTNTMRFRPT